MGTINTNIASLIAQRALLNASNAMTTSLQRLSTGLRINSAADDPAGLIASLNLGDEQTGINSALSNAQAATNMLGTADGALDQVSSLLTQLQGLVVQSANTGGLSQDQISANQAQVDSILTSINQIANSTSFNGIKLLDGNYAYNTSGAATSAFTAMTINRAIPERVVVQVANSAALGQVLHTGTSARIGASAVTLQVSGNLGTQQVMIAGSSKLSSIAASVNNISSQTGVTASTNGTSLAFKTGGYGSDQFVTIKAISGSFSLAGSGTAYATDAKVTVNGAVAHAHGLSVSYADASLDLTFQLSGSLNNGKTKTFAITGGGASFAIGPSVTASNSASIGIPSVSTGSLGDAQTGWLASLATGGANSLTGNLLNAQSIVTEAQSQVSQLRGRLGAFQKYTLGSTINSLQVAYENVSAAQSAILDTNYAQETANLTRYQLLSQQAAMAFATANSNPQFLLNLLRPAATVA